MTSEQVDHRTSAWRLGAITGVVGLVCMVFGVWGVVDSWWFGLRAEQAIATIVEIDHGGETSIDTLEFIVAGPPHRVQARGPFGVRWGPSRGMKANVPILYLPEDPNNARLADFTARYSMPLILLVLGFMFTPAGWCLCRDSRRLPNEELERFTDLFPMPKLQDKNPPPDPGTESRRGPNSLRLSEVQHRVGHLVDEPSWGRLIESSIHRC